MSEFRITLVSDPTLEYPTNTNNSFKVRLPTRLVLEGGKWVTSLWSMSVPDAGSKASLINTNPKEPLVKFGYTLTKRVRDSSWTINFTYKEKAMSVDEVMGTQYPVMSGTQLWRNIVTRLEQTIMQDVNTTQTSLKAAKRNVTTISVKKEWKPTFEWRGNELVLNAVHPHDVFALDSQSKVRPLSKVQLLTDFAKKFGLLVKNTDGSYSLGPNLLFTLPQSLYTTQTQPQNTNQRYQWLGNHYVGVLPRDLLGGTPLFKVAVEDGKSFVQLSRYVEWTFKNLDAMFNDQVGAIQETALVYCDASEPTIVGSQTHSLLRTVELKRSGKGRRDIEPLHREWIPLRKSTIESIEVSIATPSGALLELSPGKTLLTLGFKKL